MRHLIITFTVSTKMHCTRSCDSCDCGSFVFGCRQSEEEKATNCQCEYIRWETTMNEILNTFDPHQTNERMGIDHFDASSSIIHAFVVRCNHIWINNGDFSFSICLFSLICSTFQSISNVHFLICVRVNLCRSWKPTFVCLRFSSSSHKMKAISKSNEIYFSASQNGNE